MGHDIVLILIASLLVLFLLALLQTAMYQRSLKTSEVRSPLRSSKRAKNRSKGKSQNRGRSKSRGRSRGNTWLKLFSAFLVFCLGTGSGLYIIDTHVANIEYIDPLLRSFDPDLDAWRENIRSGAFGDLGQHDSSWRSSRALGYSSHQDTLSELYDEALENVHIVILICLGCGLLIIWILATIR